MLFLLTPGFGSTWSDPQLFLKNYLGDVSASNQKLGFFKN